MLARGLREAGYRVLEACNGEQALDIFAGPEKVDVMVTDLIMPHLGGLQLAELVRLSGHPPIFLFISGYHLDRSMVPGPFLEKPFAPETLVAEVRRLLMDAFPGSGA